MHLFLIVRRMAGEGVNKTFFKNAVRFFDLCSLIYERGREVSR